MIKRYPLASYFVLAALITTVVVLPIILATQELITTEVTPDWHSFGALGPILAACIVVYSLYGQRGLADYIKSLFDSRASWWLFLLAAIPALLFVLVQTSLRLLGTPQLQTIGQLSTDWWVAALVPSIAYGIGEEAGWRGFALPRLQARFNALLAVVVLTVFHALWHIPFFFYRMQFGVLETVGFFVGMLSGAVSMAFLYNQSGGKTVLPIIWHITLNLASLIAFETIPQTAYVISTLFIVIAVVVVIVFKPRNLARRERHVVHDPGQTVGTMA